MLIRSRSHHTGVMRHMPVHRIGAVVRELCIEPRVKRGHQSGVTAAKDQFAPAVHVPVCNQYLTRLCRAELGYTGHVRTVNPGWRRKVATPKLGLDFTQVHSDQPDLDRIGWILRNDALAPAIVRFRENVSRGLEIEGHNLCTALLHLSLAFCVCGEREQRCIQPSYHHSGRKQCSRFH
ncbi:hypothetical protein [Paraburkholderia bryophila]|uniref:Uncharacterized protein n=1 Tax=Paraburkholderia bryophila TaxID=420952 RepID=A0A7Z0AY92_9BURK|nr:hypothetical protein [Paraburkholderia bryophila]NYH14299.1 hypothetical protein [Paraburkholderia bryophila]